MHLFLCSSSVTPESKLVAAKRKLDLMKYATPPSVLPPSPAVASEAEPEPSTSSCENTECIGQSRDWCIVDMGQLNKLMTSVVCPECMTAGCLTVVKGGAQPMGFAESLHLQCSCGYDSDFLYSSPRVGDIERLDVPFEINTTMTLYATQIGKGHEALDAMKAVLGTETMHQKTFSRHQKKIQAACETAATEQLQSVAEVIHAAYPDVDSDDVLDITVSYDGTWQKRGFSSRHGVGVAIEVQTGLVIDLEVLSTYCHSCKLARTRLGSDTPEMKEWQNNHTDCDANFTGSSKAMEAEAARRMWMRSVERYNLRYKSILSDGDASTFAALQHLQPYGPDHPIEKLDCVNHADKRMGTALRKAIVDHKLGGKGQGRLTNAKASKLQKYYGRAIRQNIGNPIAMKDAIWATFFHSISTDDDPHHNSCPRGADSWCIFNKAEALGAEMPGHGPNTISTWLSRDVSQHINHIYHRTSDESLLERMMTGATQNANESLNSLIWVYCPKNVFVGRPRLVSAVQTAVCQFNAGSESFAAKLQQLGLQITEKQAFYLQQKDRRRVRKAEKASEALVKEARHARHLAKRQALAKLEMEEGLQYGAGLF
jgi:hypothetical protein